MPRAAASAAGDVRMEAVAARLFNGLDWGETAGESILIDSAQILCAMPDLRASEDGMELLTAAEMRGAEEMAIASGGVTGLELMERAGRGVVDAALAWRPELSRAPGRAAVLCGPGNNGGDGFVIARLLVDRGWTVEAFFYGDVARLPADAAENHRRWLAMGGEVQPLEAAGPALPHADLVIDALFGTGLTRPLEGAAAALAEEVSGTLSLGRFVAVDAPSGVCLDSGRALGAAFHAELTVTFHRPKLGHHIGDGPGRAGALQVVDIDLGAGLAIADLGVPRPGGAAPVAALIERPKVWLGKGAGGHKYSHGHALVLAGGVGKGGAARLAARAALRLGAGLVTVAPPPAALIENAARLDAIMLHAVRDAEALAELLADERLNAVVAGPGLGVGEVTRAKVAAALGGEGRGVVLDADALTSFAETPEELFALTRGKRVVLTPHLGEFGRLFPDLKARLDEPATRGPAYSKVAAAREAAARAGCVVLLKGPDTLIADPSGEASVVSAHYERACPWLATAGSGDVLAGLIGGLLARRFAPKRAVETAAWLHQEAARRFGPGLIAEDLPEEMPALLRDLTA